MTGFHPFAWASTLTVAVPLGICTRFPILSPSPTGPGALKLVFTFKGILPQPIANVNQKTAPLPGKIGIFAGGQTEAAAPSPQTRSRDSRRFPSNKTPIREIIRSTSPFMSALSHSNRMPTTAHL